MEQNQKYDNFSSWVLFSWFLWLLIMEMGSKSKKMMTKIWPLFVMGVIFMVFVVANNEYGVETIIQDGAGKKFYIFSSWVSFSWLFESLISSMGSKLKSKMAPIKTLITFRHGCHIHKYVIVDVAFDK